MSAPPDQKFLINFKMLKQFTKTRSGKTCLLYENVNFDSNNDRILIFTKIFKLCRFCFQFKKKTGIIKPVLSQNNVITVIENLLESKFDQQITKLGQI